MTVRLFSIIFVFASFMSCGGADEATGQQVQPQVKIASSEAKGQEASALAETVTHTSKE
jgi:hypothetical protein